MINFQFLKAITALFIFSSIQMGNAAAYQNDTQLELIIFLSDTYPLKRSDGKISFAGNKLIEFEEKLSAENIKYEIRPLPWVRALRDVSTIDNGIIFGLAQTRVRQNNYFWLENISPNGGSFISLYGRNEEKMKKLTREDIINGDFRIVCENATAQCHSAKEFGFRDTSIFTAPPSDKIYYQEEITLRGRVDFFISLEEAVVDNLKLMGSETDALVPLIKIDEFRSFIAAPKNINEGLYKKLVSLYR